MFNEKTGFNHQKFVNERFGVGRGRMGWRNWRDVERYYGVRCSERELEKGNMSQSLYRSLCRTFGSSQVDEYFRPTDALKPQPQPLTKEEREVEELADMMVYGRVGSKN